MNFRHEDYDFEIPDDWWVSAQMSGYVATAPCFQHGLPEPPRNPETPVLILPISVIKPIRRTLSHGVFNDGEVPAKDRVQRILRGFRDTDSLPPIEVAKRSNDPIHRYKLVNGVHRFYCAIAVQFSHIPAIEVIDYSTEREPE